ncbi:hypothetical protein MMC07_001129 [Pseudocyphellaria aurata]|nr:hypothetical protein [Pseudocyphellaria aurata]
MSYNDSYGGGDGRGDRGQGYGRQDEYGRSEGREGYNRQGYGRQDEYNGSEGREGYGRQGYGRQDEYGGNEGREGYGRQDQSEYGGGGRGSDNYYNQQSNYNDPSSGHQQGGSNYQQSGDNEYQGALSHAHQHSSYGGNSSEESSLFSNALGFLSGNKQKIAQDDDIDESQAINAHQAVYGEGRHQQQHSSETVGQGAALQALKMFTGGGSGAGGAGSQGGGNSQNQFIGLAMAQASKMFDQQSSQGKVVSWTLFLALLFCCQLFLRLAINLLLYPNMSFCQDPSASKQSAVNSAAKMALKMYMKSQGGGGGGGPGGLLGMASKFM